MSQHQVAAPVRDHLSAVTSGHDHLVDRQEGDRCRDEALDRSIEQLRDSTSASLVELTGVREGDTSPDHAPGEATAILHRHVTQRQKLLEEPFASLRPTVAHDHNPTPGRHGTGPRP